MTGSGLACLSHSGSRSSRGSAFPEVRGSLFAISMHALVESGIRRGQVGLISTVQTDQERGGVCFRSVESRQPVRGAAFSRLAYTAAKSAA